MLKTSTILLLNISHEVVFSSPNEKRWRMVFGRMIHQKMDFVILLFIFLFFREDFLHGHELSYDILCTLRSDNNRRAAGAVCVIHDQRLVFIIESSEYRRPGGEAFLFVLSVLW